LKSSRHQFDILFDDDYFEINNDENNDQEEYSDDEHEEDPSFSSISSSSNSLLSSELSYSIHSALDLLDVFSSLIYSSSLFLFKDSLSGHHVLICLCKSCILSSTTPQSSQEGINSRDDSSEFEDDDIDENEGYKALINESVDSTEKIWDAKYKKYLEKGMDEEDAIQQSNEKITPLVQRQFLKRYGDVLKLRKNIVLSFYIH
jgi:hypothetical protein